MNLKEELFGDLFQPEFEKGQIVALTRAYLIPPSLDSGFTVLLEDSIGTVMERYHINEEESEMLKLPAGWHYALHSDETSNIFIAYEDDLELASDRSSLYYLGDMVLTKRDLSYVPLINAGDNETIPQGTRALITEEKNPDGFIRIAPVEVHTLRQYLVKPSDIELDPASQVPWDRR